MNSSRGSDRIPSGIATPARKSDHPRCDVSIVERFRSVPKRGVLRPNDPSNGLDTLQRARLHPEQKTTAQATPQQMH